jgi:hypothetical protein
MPSQLIHLQVCADALGPAGVAQRHLDQFFLGAIAPDAWSVAGLSRGATHFWTPTDDTSGATRMAQAHPELAEPAALSPHQRAILAGYLCHLVTDEQWTFTVYRPYFGRHSRLGASAEARRLQLALQCLMEQRLRDDRSSELNGWLAILAGAGARAGLPFISDQSVAAWRDLQIRAAGEPTAPMAFDYVLRNRNRNRPDGAGTAEALAGEWPALAARAAAHVSPASLATFQQRASGACATVLADWLPA